MSDFLFNYPELLLGVALIVGIIGRYQVVKHKRRASWEKVQGIIEDRYDECTGPGRASTIVIYKYLITYRYKLMNREYTGQGYCHFKEFSEGDGEHQEKIHGKFKKGNSIDVYVNPQYPKESVLFTAPENEGMRWYLVAACCVLFYFGILFAGW